MNTLHASLIAGQLIVLVSTTTVAETPTCPGLATPLVSPSGRWAIECRPKPDAEPDKPHRIYLNDLRSGRSEALRSFDRWTTLFWSPMGDRIAVTDGEGSNVSNSFVYTPGSNVGVLDVFDLLNRQVPRSRLRFLNGKDHVYLEVINWADNTHVRVRLWGHGDGQKFDRRFVLFVPRQGS